jgi:hypothetical protein
MGILNKLETEGSKFTYTADGAVATPYPDSFIPDTNQLATGNSPLHSLDGVAGYSLTGNNANAATALYNQYKDGVQNPLPNPSTLDLNGEPPSYGKYEDGELAGSLGF